jgi:hypothetical protein
MIASKMKVVRLTIPLQLLVPALMLSSLSRSTRGVTLYPGRFGLALGLFMVGSTVVISGLLGPTGFIGPALAFWTVGTAGIAMVASAVEPMAFVKPICVRCRLLPIIKEHEAIHLTGVASENSVWASMRTRHSSRSLSLEGDPAICWFCPISKRLSES